MSDDSPPGYHHVRLSAPLPPCMSDGSLRSQRLRRSTRRRYRLTNSPFTPSPGTPGRRSRLRASPAAARLYSPFGIETPSERPGRAGCANSALEVTPPVPQPPPRRSVGYRATTRNTLGVARNCVLEMKCLVSRQRQSPFTIPFLLLVFSRFSHAGVELHILVTYIIANYDIKLQIMKNIFSHRRIKEKNIHFYFALPFLFSAVFF